GEFMVAVVDPPPVAPSAAPGPLPTDPPDPRVELAAVDNQQLLAATEEDSQVYDLRTESILPNAAFNLTLLQVSFTVAELVFPLLNEVRLLKFFDKGGSLIVDTIINARTGRIFTVRGIALLLVLQVNLRIRVRVAVVVSIVFDPSGDLAFENELPV